MKAVKKSRKLFAAGDKNGSDLLIWRVGVDDVDGEDYWILTMMDYDDNDNDNDDKNYVKNDNFHVISLNRRTRQRQLFSITYPGPLYFTH